MPGSLSGYTCNPPARALPVAPFQLAYSCLHPGVVMETKPGGEGREGREERVAITAAANVPAVPRLQPRRGRLPGMGGAADRIGAEQEQGRALPSLWLHSLQKPPLALGLV